VAVDRSRDPDLINNLFILYNGVFSIRKNMPGFSIYSGDIRSDAQLSERLNGYTFTKDLVENGDHYGLTDEVQNFEVRRDGTIQFTYSSDARASFHFRGRARSFTRTNEVNVRIIRSNTLIYLWELVNGVKPSEIATKMSTLIYDRTSAITKVKITSDVIKEIESRDYRKISAEGFFDLTDRDSLLVAYGNLAIRQENGSEDFSEVHSRYRNKSKGYTRFKSMSTGSEVFISAKKSSLSMKGPRLSLNNVERYIKSNLIDRLQAGSRG